MISRLVVAGALLGLGLVCCPARLQAATESPRQLALREGQPHVSWFEPIGWQLAPGYPKLAGGGTLTPERPPPADLKQYDVAVPAGATVLLRFDQPVLPGMDASLKSLEFSFSAAQVTVRNSFNNRSRNVVEHYDFELKLGPPPPDFLNPGDSFTLSAQGKASTDSPQVSPDAEAGLGLSINDVASDNPGTKGFSLGDRLGPWQANGSAELPVAITAPGADPLDWGRIEYELDIGLRVRFGYSYTREPRPAIVFLPGVAGTALSSRTSIAGFEVWPTALISNRANLGLEPDGKTPAIKGASIRVDGLLRSKPTNFYGGLLSFLANKGYEEGKDLFPFPYDWRLDNREHFVRLEELVRKAGREDDEKNKRKVILIAHSMGGVIARAYLLSSAERRKNVKSFISIATPYFGAPKVFYGFAEGYSFGNPRVRQELMKVLIQNLPAGYQLVPWVPFVQEGNRVYSLEETYSMRYRGFVGLEPGFLGDTYEPTADSPWFMNPNQVASARAFRDSQGSKSDPTPIQGPAHHVIIGTGVKTLSRYELGDGKFGGAMRLGKRAVDLEPVFLDGDGTVPLWGLEISGATRSYYVPYVDRLDAATGLRDLSSGHGDLPGNATVQAIVARILDGKPPEPAEYARSTELVDLEGVDLSLHSNATLALEGEGGRLGFYANGAIEESLPTGTFLATSNGEYASVARIDRPYTAVVTGTGSGKFSLGVLIRRRAGSVAYSYPDVAVAAGTSARVVIDPRSKDTPPPLSVTTAGATIQVPAVLGTAPTPLASQTAPAPTPSAPPATTPARPPFEYDTNRYGGDYRNFKPAREDPAECSDACRGDPRCRAWSYVKPGYESPGCWLKDSQPPPTANPCCISGTNAPGTIAPGTAPPAAATPAAAPPVVATPAAAPPAVATPAAAPAEACPYSFDAYRNTGKVLTCYCSPEAAAYDGRLYGIDEYPDDSYLCKAARHSGVIGPQGGNISARGTPGRSSYPASTRNGVTSGTWGQWVASVRIEAPGR